MKLDFFPPKIRRKVHRRHRHFSSFYISCFSTHSEEDQEAGVRQLQPSGDGLQSNHVSGEPNKKGDGAPS